MVEDEILLQDLLDGLKRENPDVQNAAKAMQARGLSKQFVDEEIARAFLGCLWERDRGLPDRYSEVLTALGNGTSSESLFPDELYQTGNGAAKN
jgi:hypothetical protein